SVVAGRKQKTTFSSTFNQGKHASSWKTTPIPSGTLSPIARPSNSISPSVGAVRPAISSSRVDFPQPDGPTTAKNSPFRISMSIGPRACTGFPACHGGKHFCHPAQRHLGRQLGRHLGRHLGRGHAMILRCAALLLFHLLQIIRQEAGIDNLGQ